MTTESAGIAAPDFTLPTADGQPVQFRKATGRVAVVIFTCNHCPYALAWHDRVQAVARDYGASAVDFFQINPNDVARVPLDAPSEMARRVANGEFASPYLRDESQSVAREWGAAVTPHVFVVSRTGAIVYQGAPDGNYQDQSLNAGWLRLAIDAALADRAPELADTKPVGCSIKWKQ